MIRLDDNTLVAYVDGELDAATAQEVERMLENDPVARNKVLKLSQSAILLRAAYNTPVHEAVPERLLDVLEPPRRALWRRLVPFGTAIVGLVVGLGGGFIVKTLDAARNVEVAGVDELIEDIAAHHAIFARDEEYLVEVPAERVVHLEDWAGTHLNRRLRVPDLSEQGFDFRGGRLLVAGDRPVSELVYTAPDRIPLAVCITLGEGVDRTINVVRSHGFTLLSWQRSGYRYVIVGDEDEAFMRKLAAGLTALLEKT